MRVTLKDIARAANVSVNTVSLALRNMPGVNGETKARILQITNQMGYYEQKTTREAQNICLISTGERLRDSYFYMSFYQHILSKVHEFRYNMLVYNSSNCMKSPDELRQNFKANSVSGIIVLGDMDEAIVENVARCGVPMIAIGTRYHRLDVCTFIEDNLEGAHMAVDYLHRHGYRKIGFIGRALNSTGFMERYQGFMGAMAQFGLPVVPQWTLMGLPPELEYDFQEVAQLMRSLPKMPEAFICANDNVAMIAAKALHSMGLHVPQDVSLIGFDNSTGGKMAIPSITSVDVQCALQADVSVKSLMDFIQRGRCDHARIVLPVVMSEGDSVGRLDQ